MANMVVHQVRVKKRDGKAEFTSESLRWTPSDSAADATGSSSMMVPWHTVQDLQVSSMTSPKAMIRLRMTNNSTLVMEFLGDSLEKAFEIRNQAKEFISQRIADVAASGTKHPSSHAAADRIPLCNATEIKQRAALLASNPILKRQHTEMVNQGLISEEDFWATRRHLIANEAAKRQRTGKTSAILTDLTADNGTGGHVIKYNLNAEVIHQIFIQYPAVHLAYKAQVPDKMTETEFWGAFFKSKYFHRDRKAGHEDLFTRFEEKELEEQAKTRVDPRGVVDPLVDLTATAEDQCSPALFAEDKKQNGGFNANKSSTRRDAMEIIISKFNRHSAYVLDPVHAGKITSKAQQLDKKASYRDTIQDATKIDDLELKVGQPLNPLTLEDESRYFDHSDATNANANTDAQAQTQAPTNTANGNPSLQAHQLFAATCKSQIHLKRAFPDAPNAMNALSEILSCCENGPSGNDLTSSSFMTTSSNAQAAAELIPNEFKKQIYNQFHDVSELLRHFLAFKAKVSRGDPDAKHKLNRIVEKMGLKYDELAKIRESLPPHEKNLLAPLLKPFDDQLNLAFI